MGSCVTTNTSYRVKVLEKTGNLSKNPLEYAYNHPIVIREIFYSKDLQAPKLNIKSNKLRNSRLKRFNSINLQLNTPY